MATVHPPAINLPHTGTATSVPPTGGGAPSLPLLGWAEIIGVLVELHGAGRWQNDDKSKGKIKKLHKLNPGPIIFRGKGSQPSVGRQALINWMTEVGDDYDRRAEEQRQAGKSARLTAGTTHNYGRTGVVAPELNGDVHKSRSKRRQS